MGELLTAYYTADQLGAILALVAITAVFGIVRHSERLRPDRKSSDD